MNPTIVLVHGAFADSSSWNGSIAPLQRAGHRTVAFANPLRGVAADVDETVAVLRHVRLERGAEPTDGVRTVLGRAPRDFADHARLLTRGAIPEVTA